MAAIGRQPERPAAPAHPGKGGRRGRITARGRQVRPEARDELRELLGDRPRRRDHLIEFLHLVQDRWGHISTQHVAALADELRLAQTEVYEVATFYHHFDVVKEGENPPPPLTVRVCDSLSCAMAGAEALLAELRAALDPSAVRVLPAPCMGACSNAPAVMVGKRRVEPATASSVQAAVAAGEVAPLLPEPIGFADYIAGGGYRLYRRIAGLDPEALSGDPWLELLAALDGSGLRGLGGAGFPTGKKWEIVRRQPAPRYLCVNADEGEPGTFKDRYYLRRDPHRFLEGVLIAARSIEAAGAFIYLRDEYPAILEVLRRELALLEAEGVAPRGLIELRRGAGAYICGEESAMLSIIADSSPQM